MSHETMIREYYRILQKHSYDPLMTLFSKEAVIVHPIFGNMPATDFFKILLDRAKSHEIAILTLFSALEQRNRMAVYLNAKFTTKDNTKFDEHSVHIFDFSTEGLIEKLTVVIDTYPFRGEYSHG